MIPLTRAGQSHFPGWGYTTAPPPAPAPTRPPVQPFFYPCTPLPHNSSFPPQRLSNWPQPRLVSAVPVMDSLGQDHTYDDYQRQDDVYSPNSSGPAVGPLLPTTDLVVEYQDADPNYKIKTQNINRAYPRLRKCRGDGDCGWRAIAFGYFEILLRTGDGIKISREVERLKSIDSLLIAFGLCLPDMLEDFTEPTFQLMDHLQEWVYLPNRIQMLVDFFNNEAPGESRVFHFRLLACAAMHSNPEKFVYYLYDTTIPDYCNQMMAVYFEIDEPAIQALYDILLEPAGFGLEILDLNRSPGVDIHVHPRMPDTLAGEECVVRLLYRPGHYDLIYKNTVVHTSSSTSTTMGSSIPQSHMPKNNVKVESKPDLMGHSNMQSSFVGQQHSTSSGNAGFQSKHLKSFAYDSTTPMSLAMCPSFSGYEPHFSGGYKSANLASFEHSLPTLHEQELQTGHEHAMQTCHEQALQNYMIGPRFSRTPDDANFHSTGDTGVSYPDVTFEMLNSSFWSGGAFPNPFYPEPLAHGLPSAPYSEIIPSPTMPPSDWLDQELAALDDFSSFSLYDHAPMLPPDASVAAAAPTVHTKSFFEESRASYLNVTAMFDPHNLTPEDGGIILTRGRGNRPSSRKVKDVGKKAIKIRKGKD